EEDAAILSAMHLEAMLLAKFLEDAIDQASAVGAELHDRVFEAGRAGVDQELAFLGVVGPAEKGPSAQRHGGGAGRAKHVASVHGSAQKVRISNSIAATVSRLAVEYQWLARKNLAQCRHLTSAVLE